MARIKGGLNAKKRHNRTLKLAKGYRGARSKQYRIAKQSVMRALATAYAGRRQKKRQFRQLCDRTYQCCCKNERSFLQQADARPEGCKHRYQQKDACRDGCKRCGRIHRTGRDRKESDRIKQDRAGCPGQKAPGFVIFTEIFSIVSLNFYKFPLVFKNT